MLAKRYTSPVLVSPCHTFICAVGGVLYALLCAAIAAEALAHRTRTIEAFLFWLACGGLGESLDHIWSPGGHFLWLLGPFAALRCLPTELRLFVSGAGMWAPSPRVAHAMDGAPERWEQPSEELVQARDLDATRHKLRLHHSRQLYVAMLVAFCSALIANQTTLILAISVIAARCATACAAPATPEWLLSTLLSLTGCLTFVAAARWSVALPRHGELLQLRIRWELGNALDVLANPILALAACVAVMGVALLLRIVSPKFAQGLMWYARAVAKLRCVPLTLMAARIHLFAIDSFSNAPGSGPRCVFASGSVWARRLRFVRGASATKYSHLRMGWISQEVRPKPTNNVPLSDREQLLVAFVAAPNAVYKFFAAARLWQRLQAYHLSAVGHLTVDDASAVVFNTGVTALTCTVIDAVVIYRHRRDYPEYCTVSDHAAFFLLCVSCLSLLLWLIHPKGFVLSTYVTVLGEWTGRGPPYLPMEKVDLNHSCYFTPSFAHVFLREGPQLCPGVPLDVLQHEVAPFIGEAHASCLKADRDADDIVAVALATVSSQMKK